MAFGDVERSYTINLIGKDKASAAFRSVDSSATRTSKIMSGLTKTLKYAAFAAGAALAAAAAMGAKYLWDATKAAYADDQAMKALARTQRKAQQATDAQVKSTKRWIDRMELATRFSDDQMRPALSALALTGMGVKKSLDLLAVAMDVAEARGKPLQTVAEALVKAYNGSTGGLARLGVATKNAAGESLTFAQILKTLKQRTEGAAAAAARRDPWTVLGNAMQQVKEKIGKALLPEFRKLARWLIDNFVPWVKNSLVPAVKRFSAWIRDEAVPWIRDKLIPALKSTWSWFQESLLPAILGVYKAFAPLIKSIGEFLSRLDKGGDSAKGFVTVMQYMTLNLRIVLGIVTGIVWALNKMIDAMTWVADHAGTIGDALKSMASSAAGVPGLGALINLVNADGGYLPGRARGGWVRVGEHGPEMLNARTGYMLPHSRSMGGAGSPAVIQNFYAPQDPVAVGRETTKALLQYKRATGGRDLGFA